jgi:hypothetical protein
MTPSIAADQVSYADLYARWEQGNWRATDLDLSIDRQQWEHEFTEVERRGAQWTYPRSSMRGLGNRQPVAVHQRRATRRAEVLPGHPAGR